MSRNQVQDPDDALAPPTQFRQFASPHRCRNATPCCYVWYKARTGNYPSPTFPGLSSGTGTRKTPGHHKTPPGPRKTPPGHRKRCRVGGPAGLCNESAPQSNVVPCPRAASEAIMAALTCPRLAAVRARHSAFSCPGLATYFPQMQRVLAPKARTWQAWTRVYAIFGLNGP